jgi:glycosyltransferase involved in cell wall biosynthesis
MINQNNESMSTTELISVVTPVYNTEMFIGKTIESVLSQTYSNFELILVDDGSTDDVHTEIQKFLCDSRIKYIRQEKKGPSAARNTGIQHSRGELIAFLDGDDCWEPSKLEKQVRILQLIPDIDVVYCKFHRVDSACNPLPDSQQLTPPPADLYKALLFGNIIYGSCSAVVVRADALKKAGNFDEELYIGEDQELWQRLACQHKFYCIDEYLVYIRTHDKSAQANEEYFEKGQLIYLNRLKSIISAEYRNLWTQIAYNKYIDFIQLYFHEGSYRKTLKFVLLIIHLGPKSTIHFLLKITKASIKKVFNIFKKTLRNIVFSQKFSRILYLSQRNKKKIADWNRSGNPIPVPPEVKQQIILGFLKSFNIEIFIETGTFLGDMVEAMRYDFTQIYSIELSTELYAAAVNRFAGVKNVVLLQGDSGKTLLDLMPDLREPCVFWLDAHYSEGVTARGDKETPVVEELEAISRHSFKAKDIILIDDASGFGRGDHPPLEWVNQWAKKQGFDTFEVEFDIIRIYNRH